MYATCIGLTSRELSSIEERARSLGGNYVNVATAMTLAQQDVPALLAEVRRLQEMLETIEKGRLAVC
jgi:hypothetical protein